LSPASAPFWNSAATPPGCGIPAKQQQSTHQLSILKRKYAVTRASQVRDGATVPLMCSLMSNARTECKGLVLKLWLQQTHLL
jgi:hypothetical protein